MEVRIDERFREIVEMQLDVLRQQGYYGDEHIASIRRLMFFCYEYGSKSSILHKNDEKAVVGVDVSSIL